MATCPACANDNPNFRFCVVCGFKLPYAPEPPRARPAPLPDDLTNMQLERYQLAQCLGEDAISHYYAARHFMPDITRPFVLRVLKRTAAEDEAAMSRFREDARRLSKDQPIDAKIHISDFTLVGEGDRRAVMVFGISGDAPVTLAELLAYTATS